MALIRTDMNLVGSGGYGKVWSYNTLDAHTAVIAASYFNSMAAQLNVGDRIHLKDATGIYDLVVATNNGTAVTVLSSAAYA